MTVIQSKNEAQSLSKKLSLDPYAACIKNYVVCLLEPIFSADLIKIRCREATPKEPIRHSDCQCQNCSDKIRISYWFTKPCPNLIINTCIVFFCI